MALKVRVGKKGYIVIPKSIREVAGVKEGEELVVGVEGGRIILEPVRKVDLKELRQKMREHLARISYVNRKPVLGELAGALLEEEFEDVS
ncbi:AbrB family transcriptional regulator [Candidatus Marsarchaeota G2 archaeon ECH_B_2]|uniref:AbrB family transcriptional regulator n=3 Tax=Candidatus Marsarchaeota group 2 TaxID=2203771 RepID=A0A2R6B7K5_9ARCH|nr:MAG: AbrB family transcriptional regulator [Candidatus Marsarchaeota G2 archaeon ECH_B_2]PSN96156.1 MAG: AbrB family transcriptional regulator [Candidatus Marsarchaeota G2 archaeon ECH_B_2]PSN98338.1 MAG: AbrB family transcriptional regulator [Candidatus Marsarchaeota G2 archaeon ECH_B_3]PSO02643.1 MAG: AbrB family transcriptional regulator [Candidatus Marsarchaeota G2 archaeon ECH_B_1]